MQINNFAAEIDVFSPNRNIAHSTENICSFGHNACEVHFIYCTSAKKKFEVDIGCINTLNRVPMSLLETCSEPILHALWKSHWLADRNAICGFQEQKCLFVLQNGILVQYAGRTGVKSAHRERLEGIPVECVHFQIAFLINVHHVEPHLTVNVYVRGRHTLYMARFHWILRHRLPDDHLWPSRRS